MVPLLSKLFGQGESSPRDSDQSRHLVDARVRACQAVADAATASAAKASQASDAAKAKLDAASDRVSRAERAAAEHESDANFAKLAAAQSAHGLALRTYTQAARDASQAFSSAETARTALASALAAVEHETKLRELRARASLANYRARVAPHALAFVEAERAMRVALTAIDAAFDDADMAAHELRSLGIEDGTEPLDSMHRAVAIVEALATRTPALLNVAFAPDGRALHPMRHLVQNGIAPALLSSLAKFEAMGGRVPLAGAPERFAMVTAGRTLNAGLSVLRDSLFIAGDMTEINRRVVDGEAAPDGHSFPAPMPTTAKVSKVDE